jgi:diguanylate cyclase (GGDEF)-like protein
MRVWQWAVLGGIGVGIAVMAISLIIGDDNLRGVCNAVAQGVAPVVCIAAAVGASLEVPSRRDKMAWMGVAAAALALIIGLAPWALFARDASPLSLWGLVGSALSYLCLWAALALRSGDFPEDPLGRSNLVVDLLLAAGGALALARFFVLPALAVAPEPARSLLILFPVLAFLTATVLLCMLPRAAARLQHGPRAMWAAAVVALLGADLLRVGQLTWQTGYIASPAELLRPLAFLLFATAAVWEYRLYTVHAPRAREIDHFPAITGLAVLLSLLLAAFAVSLLRLLHPEQFADDPVGTLQLAALLAVLLVVRLVLTHLSAHRLYHSLHRRYTEVALHAATDALTGVPNQRTFSERYDREMRRAVRYKRPLSLIFVDLDHFKSINDTHGHAAGDEALIEVAQRLCDGVRETDLVARYGGEEFVVLLPETNLRAASTLAERLRRGVASAKIQGEGDTIFRVTASLGVAAYPETADSADTLLHTADQAMYHAKADGRNRVVQARRTEDVASAR